MLTLKENKVLKIIKNSILLENKIPSIRNIMNQLGYKSPRSISLILEGLISKGIVIKNNGKIQIGNHSIDSDQNAETISIPLLGNIACGTPISAQENYETLIPISKKFIDNDKKYFFLRAKGDSMDLAGILDGDLVLVKQQDIANNGDIVVALIDEEATIKEIKINNNSIILLPKSSNPKHQPIILTSDFLIQGIVVTTIKI